MLNWRKLGSSAEPGLFRDPVHTDMFSEVGGGAAKSDEVNRINKEGSELGTAVSENFDGEHYTCKVCYITKLHLAISRKQCFLHATVEIVHNLFSFSSHSPQDSIHSLHPLLKIDPH